MTNIQEQQYIKAFCAGDARAFDVLFLLYQPQLVAFIEGFIKNHEEARDMTQDIFLRLWENRTSCNDIRSLKGFLFRSAKFAIYNYYDHMLVNEKYVEQCLMAPIEVEDTEDQVFLKELQERIAQTISEMPAQRKRVFEMSRTLGISNDKIAENLGISKRTVENHLSLALSMLRKIAFFIMILLNVR